MKKIYVDADACPVKDEIVKVATRHKIEVFMVCNGGIRPFRNNLINLIIVPERSDEADKWIFENINPKDELFENNLSDEYLYEYIILQEEDDKFLAEIDYLLIDYLLENNNNNN